MALKQSQKLDYKTVITVEARGGSQLGMFQEQEDERLNSVTVHTEDIMHGVRMRFPAWLSPQKLATPANDFDYILTRLSRFTMNEKARGTKAWKEHAWLTFGLIVENVLEMKGLLGTAYGNEVANWFLKASKTYKPFSEAGLKMFHKELLAKV